MAQSNSADPILVDHRPIIHRPKTSRSQGGLVFLMTLPGQLCCFWLAFGVQ